MTITAIGQRQSVVPVNELKLYTRVYTNGYDETDCISQISEIMEDVKDQYAMFFSNFRGYSINHTRARCIDSRGMVTAESECIICINDSSEDLAESIRAFNQVCSNMEDTVKLDGWETSLSGDMLHSVISSVVSSAYKDALFECSCLVPEGMRYNIDDTAIFLTGENSKPHRVELPDSSSCSREVILETLDSVIELNYKVGRSVKIKASY